MSLFDGHRIPNHNLIPFGREKEKLGGRRRRRRRWPLRNPGIICPSFVLAFRNNFESSNPINCGRQQHSELPFSAALLHNIQEASVVPTFSFHFLRTPFPNQTAILRSLLPLQKRHFSSPSPQVPHRQAPSPGPAFHVSDPGPTFDSYFRVFLPLTATKLNFTLSFHYFRTCLSLSTVNRVLNLIFSPEKLLFFRFYRYTISVRRDCNLNHFFCFFFFFFLKYRDQNPLPIYRQWFSFFECKSLLEEYRS